MTPKNTPIQLFLVLPHACVVRFSHHVPVSLVCCISLGVALSRRDSRDRRRGGGFDSGGGFGGGRGIGFNTYFGPSPFDFFYYRPYYGYYGTPVPRGGRRGDPEEMG